MHHSEVVIHRNSQHVVHEFSSRKIKLLNILSRSRYKTVPEKGNVKLEGGIIEKGKS